MHQFTGKVILILILISFVLGAMVVTLTPNYNRRENIRSNRRYYPSVKMREVVSKDTEEESNGAQGY